MNDSQLARWGGRTVKTERETDYDISYRGRLTNDSLTQSIQLQQ